MRNPFASRKSGLDRALAVAEDVRSEAAEIAGTVRDAAARAAEALGEAAPKSGGRRLPLIGATLAAAAGVTYVIRSRARGGEPSPPPSPAVRTAAKTTAPA